METKVLKDARLVVDRPAGSRRIYQLDPDGVGALRAELDRFWSRALVATRRKLRSELRRTHEHAGRGDGDADVAGGRSADRVGVLEMPENMQRLKQRLENHGWSRTDLYARRAIPRM
jgi:hypothetical protein